MTAGVVQPAPCSSRVGLARSPFQALSTRRQRFYVELKEGEMNVVSWKKLSKDAPKDPRSSLLEVPAGANPALEARMAPDQPGPVHAGGGASQEPLSPPPNRFSSVIEKIERLYKGGESEEDDGDVSPDDSQYDTEDDFIDDSELNEYFSLKNVKTKHTGFFVNRGKLEKIDEHPQLPPAHVPQRRKRTELSEEAVEEVLEPFAKKRVNTGLRLKVAARKLFSSHMVDVRPGSSTAQDRHAEQAYPKLHKRLKPISEIANIAPSRIGDTDALRVDKIEDAAVEMRRKFPMIVVELSDDENDTAEVGKEDADKDQKLSSYNPKKPALEQKQCVRLDGNEKFSTSLEKGSVIDS